MQTPTLPIINEQEFQLRKCFMQYRHHFKFAEQLLTLTLEQADANYNLKLTILLKNTTIIAYCHQSSLVYWLSEALDSADFSYLPLELQLSLLKEHGKFFPSLQWLNIESLHITEAKLGIKGHFNMAGKALSLWFPQIEAIQRLLPKRRWAEKYPLVVSLSICMVPIYLTINTLNTLEIGDILLQPHYVKKHQQLAYIEHLPWAWVSLSSHQLELINMYSETDNLANQSLTNLEEIQIPIRFEVGRQYIELQALTHLSERSLIDLAVPVNGDVRIIANQQPLGTGQLVEIQGRLGIKVVELFAKKTEPLFTQSEELSPLTNPSDENGGTLLMNQLPDELSLIIGLILLALIPFIAVMATSFVKMAMVFSLLRNALGVQQIPPNMAIYGLSIILTLYVMAPVALATKDFLNENPISLSANASLEYFFEEGTKPYKSFLTKHINPREKEFFNENIAKYWPAKYANSVSSDSLFILLPAFTISELTRAFEIGFLLYLPFIAIDLIVSNILLAMGMMMVSPMTISLPFKLLLFVMFDGWSRLSHGLVLSYAG